MRHDIKYETTFVNKNLGVFRLNLFEVVQILCGESG